jgi:hypothetical protein
MLHRQVRLLARLSESAVVGQFAMFKIGAKAGVCAALVRARQAVAFATRPSRR